VTKKLKLYYYDKVPNFGDVLNVDIFSHYGFKVINTPCSDADAVGIGSILGHLKKSNFSGIVLGSGLISKDDSFDGRNCDIQALRGPLTLERVKGAGNVVFGDLGLLVSHVFPSALSKSIKKISIMPHYVDLNNPFLLKMLNESADLNLINVTNNSVRVLTEIVSSKLIITSSLHGLIAADSYGIPAIWVSFSNDILGDEFKYKDYMSGVGYDRECVYIKESHSIKDLMRYSDVAPENKIYSVKFELNNIMRKFSRRYLFWKAKKYFI
jgi:pyruvyltransferase